MEVWGGNQAVERCFETPGLRIWIYSRPYGEAAGGGDVYYLSSCASGRITRMLLADVSGHGGAVSHLAIALRDLMRRNVNYIKQTRFVQAMNGQFADFAEQGGFATALVTTFFAPTRTFSLCNAGHPAPLMCRANSSEWSELKSDVQPQHQVSDIPLGISGDVDYRQFDTKLRPGDMVLSYSDAVIESLDAEGRQLGQSGILKFVRDHATGEPGRLLRELVDRIAALAPSNLQQDDATLLLCQATGTGPTFMNNLLAPFRLFRGANDRTSFR